MALTKNRTPTKSVPGPRCSVCIALMTMDDADRATLTEWLANPRLQSLELVQWLAADGIDFVGQQAVQRHRRGACSGTRRGLV